MRRAEQNAIGYVGSNRALYHRIQVVQAVLDLTDRQIAKALGVSIEDWHARKLPAGASGRIEKAFGVCGYWLVIGDGADVGRHLSHGSGKVAILPAPGRRSRQVRQEQEDEGMRLWRLAQDMVAAYGHQKAREMLAARQAPPDDPKPA
jgi:hypothetical protein